MDQTNRLFKTIVNNNLQEFKSLTKKICSMNYKDVKLNIIVLNRKSLHFIIGPNFFKIDYANFKKK